MQNIQIEIPAKLKKYPIFVGSNLINNLSKHLDLSKYTQVAILTDDALAAIWLNTLKEEIKKQNSKILDIIIPKGEVNKNLNTVKKIWSDLSKHEFDRNSIIICLGGGVVGDLGGFVAATYMRGIDCIQIPTTLLAQVDSSVGGKTGFDFLNQKNNIGAFKQPITVVIDIATLESLPERPFLQGFAEIIKYGLIKDYGFLKWLNQNAEYLIDRRSEEFTSVIIEAIKKSIQIKSQIVTQDETESKGVRKLLNFGHTFGHAIEIFSLTDKNHLYHGEAVSIGIHFETKLSAKIGLIDSKSEKEVIEILQRFNLPTTYEYDKNQENLTKLEKSILQDKKNLGGKVKWTLLENLGKGIIDQEVDTDIWKKLIQDF